MLVLRSSGLVGLKLLRDWESRLARQAEAVLLKKSEVLDWQECIFDKLKNAT